ncbi:hypothetical protein KP509_1Z034900 [Ceratopteris richardii]|nr:hypothetical protein KP509_1Z034900 [Ceratopteris richardii]
MPPKQGAPGKQKPSSTAVSEKTPIEELYAALDGSVRANDLKLIVKNSERILTEYLDDSDALLCKVVALIQEDKLDDALLAIKSAKILNESLNFYKVTMSCS